MKMKEVQIIKKEDFSKFPYNYRLIVLKPKSDNKSKTGINKRVQVIPVFPFYKTMSRY